MEDGTILKLRNKTYVLDRLAFLGDFLKSVDCKCTKEIARIILTSWQNVSIQLSKDDLTLTQIISIINHYGYDVEFRLDKDDQTNVKNAEIKNKKMHVVRDSKHFYYKIETGEEEKRMFFILYALKKYGFTKSDITKAGIASRPTVSQRFQKDDCPFSFITDIAEKFELKLFINITHKNLKTDEKIEN